ncbi:hypothetical protein [Blastococcus sp. KM273129]|uniref:hypothetical protein n=1 Tax=Blastococcus sp. KM273129 TaxID=2570315 RepID=UPI001F1BBE41|nr:hypothetical protein [Blastococcus sp. KM273129]MCF6735227.1 hypothetical protein [Blastococcus sp. KM273129]
MLEAQDRIASVLGLAPSGGRPAGMGAGLHVAGWASNSPDANRWFFEEQLPLRGRDAGAGAGRRLPGRGEVVDPDADWPVREVPISYPDSLRSLDVPGQG